MSFKLAGDQYREINRIQKRRVADLLADNIPEDEAFLMKNGRYACLVCRHRPTFDTLSVLSIHRAGKAHNRAAHTVTMRKWRDREEIEKREQGKQLVTCSLPKDSTDAEPSREPAPLLLATQAATRRALLTACPYSSLVAKSRAVHNVPEKDGDQEGEEKEGGHDLFFSRKRRMHNYDVKVIVPAKKQHVAGDGAAHSTDAGSESKPQPDFVFPWNTGVKTARTVISRDPKKATVTCMSEKDTKRAEYVQRRRAGWLLDPSGEWCRDPGVEFDSDEEPPLPP